MAYLYDHIRNCQFCGTLYDKKDFSKKEKSFHCHSCGRVSFVNSVPAVTVVIPLVGQIHKILMTRRNINPGKGKLDLPGGFLHLDESPKKGILREVGEEIGIKIELEGVLDTIPQKKYDYQGIWYQPLITYFIAKPIKALPKKLDKKEIKGIVWQDVRNVKSKNQYAFPEDLQAINLYKKFIE